jgi:HrpA-like RNA helicase
MTPTSITPLFRHVWLSAFCLQIGAASPNHKGRIEPTQVGHFLAALPISLDSSLLLVQGGLQGLTREAVMLAALLNTTPFPILQPFGADAMRHVKQYSSNNGSSSGSGGSGSSGGAFTVGVGPIRGGRGSRSSAAVDCTVEVADAVDTDAASKFGRDPHPVSKQQYFGSTGNSLRSITSGMSSLAATAAASPSDDAPGGVTRPQLLLANMAAYYAWQQQWCDQQHLQALQAADPQQQQQKHSSEGEGEWCRQHFLLPVSLRAVSDLMGIIYGVLHRFRPSLVAHATGAPAYFENKVGEGCVWK